jgi:membrane AbrB-like protein
MAACQPAVTEAPEASRLSRRAYARALFRLSAFLLAGAAGGWAAQWIGSPLPWMIGPLVVTAALCLSSLLSVKVPDRLRPFGQVVVALQVGLTFTPQTLERLIALAPVIITTALATLACIFVVAFAVARVGGMTLAQSFLAAVPTSPVEAAAMAVDKNVDPVPVVISQTLRLSAVVLVLPLAIYTIDGWPASRVRPGGEIPFDPLNILLLLACGFAAVHLFRFLRIPNPNFLGPLTAAAALAVTGYGLPPFPAAILAVAQIVLGSWLGSTLRREFLGSAGRLAVVSLASILLLLLMCSLTATGIAWVFGLDWRLLVFGRRPRRSGRDGADGQVPQPRRHTCHSLPSDAHFPVHAEHPLDSRTARPLRGAPQAERSPAMSDYRPLPKDRPARIAVMDDYMGVAHRLADWSRLAGRAEVTFLTEPLPAGEAAARLARFDAICLLRERSAMPAELLRALPNLKAIVATGRVNRALDYRAAADLGVAVMATTGSGNGIYATVELAWGLIISLMRHLQPEGAAMRSGAWQSRLGDALYGRTLGLVGLGKLGSRMALVGRAFGMEILAWSPNLTPERAAAAGATWADKDSLLRQSDIVSLHLVLGPTTRGVIDRQALALMQHQAILINTARGPLVEEEALIDALRSERLRAAGIDVYDHEPLPPEHPLRSLPNALLTPHLGYSVRETFETFYRETVENLESWLDGAPIRLSTPET